ncbi:MAG: SDR family oxidoreductase [Clostridia bacterium]|nr:SDR family oxidoreductase [Clostridia bacterium]
MKSVLITGASRGIGFAAAKLLSERGYTVYALWHHAKENLEDYSRQNLIAVQGDVSDPDVMAQVKAQIGEIDILINNAAVSHFGLLTDLSAAAWQNMINVDLNSVFYTTSLFLPGMIRQKSGCIINISSIFGAVGGSCEVAYSTAKAGVIGFTKALAKEVGPSGVRVNCVAPGVIETEMNARLSKADMDALCEEIPLGRVGRPEEVAALIAYLCEDTYITGEVIHIGGGFLQ